MSILLTLTAGLVVGFLVGAYVSRGYAQRSLENAEAEACKSIYDNLVVELNFAPKTADVIALKQSMRRAAGRARIV